MTRPTSRFNDLTIQRFNGHSPRPCAGEDHRQGATEDFQVEPERPVVNVLKVEPHPILEIVYVVTPAYLPETSQAGLDAQAAPMREVIKPFHFIHGQRARTDEAHFAAPDVEQLRQ